MKIFFIGICGISMSALAKILKTKGIEVKGSDRNLTNIPECLEGIEVFKQPYLDGVRWADLIVCSSAIKENEETILAKQLSKKVISRGALLGAVSRSYQKVIAVAGSHGKTTTTAMIFNILKAAGKDPTLHLGGNLKGYGNLHIGGKEFFVTEACEYHDNFLFLKPYISVITNVEPEHLDYFKSFNNELKSFDKFISQSMYAVTKTQHIARNLQVSDKKTLSFDVEKDGEMMCKINLAVGGMFNAKNACYAIDACRLVGVSYEAIKEGLESFQGVCKRCEKKKTTFPFDIYVDYAHHPKEISEIAEFLNLIKTKKCVAVFQPHTYSRTKNFLKEFIESLSLFDEVICFKTYPARENPEDGLNEKDLADALRASGKRGTSCETVEELYNLLKAYQKDDIVALLGAGDLPERFDYSHFA